jgi:DNA repair protein RadA/Sms
VDSRIQGATKLGFEEIYVSRFNKGLEKLSKNIKVVQVGKVEELFTRLFG